MSTKTNFPPGWDEERVRRIVEHYDSQSEEEAVAEDEAALESSLATNNRENRFVTVPAPLSPGAMLSVAVGPDEDVEWIWSHDAVRGSCITGYRIVPRKTMEELLPAPPYEVFERIRSRLKQ